MSEPARARIAVYVTSHGFGHLNRSVAVINRIPDDVAVAIRCDPSLFDHWRERLKRPADLEPHASDVGTINPPGDSAATDGPASLLRAAEVHARAMAGVDAEAARLAAEGTDVVLCDVTPVPLVAAHRAGIPGLLLANFTWAEIYEPHAHTVGTEAALATVAAVRDAYSHASLMLRTEPALSLGGIAPVVDVGMVVSPGVDRRAELRASLGIPEADRIVYFYVGRYGQVDLAWDRLGTMRCVHFVGFHPAPVGVVPNLHVAPPTHWTGADLAASADAIVAKAGYGTATEAMAARTPFLYPPRTGFAEHEALDAALQAWGGGFPLTDEEFRGLRLEAALDRAFAERPGPPPFPTDGADRVVAIILDAVANPSAYLRS